MTQQGTVVIGGGVAGHRCVMELRDGGYRDPISLVSREEHPPYDRTLLSKDMLHGEDSVELSPIDAYRDKSIDLILGQEAVALDTPNHEVVLSDGSTRPFKQLVLCMGGRPVIPKALNADGVIVVRELAHIPALRSALSAGGEVAIIGAGFIGGEVATAATELGLSVTLIEALSQPLARALGDEVGARIAEIHRSRGVRVLCDTTVNSVRASNNGYVIDLDGGTTLHADHVVIGVGMTPNIEWLEGSGIQVDHGVVTDAYCRASVDTVFAAGDCTRWWHRDYSQLCHVEHWDTANQHGAAAARSVLGDREAFVPLPFFSSDQQGVKLLWAGYAPSWDDLEIIEGETPEKFSTTYYKGGQRVGVLVAGAPSVFARLRRQLARDTNPKVRVSQ